MDDIKPMEEIAKEVEDNARPLFDLNLIRNYPKSTRKVTLEISSYDIMASESEAIAAQSVHISPFGVEFQCGKNFSAGAIVKIDVSLPDYWSRKQQFVEYRRIDTPDKFRILGKIVHVEDLGKKGKKKLITVQTVNIDEIDEKVLTSFLQD